MSKAPVVALVAPGGFLGGSFLPFFVDAAKEGTFSGLRLLTTNSAKLAGDYDPASILVKQIDYQKQDTLVEALQGVDVVVSALPSPWGVASDSLGQALVDAAAKAGVKVYFPSDWGYDYEGHPIEGSLFETKLKHREAAEKLGLKTVAVAVGAFVETFFAVPVFGNNGNNWSLLGDGNQPFAMIGVQDLARYAVRAVVLAHSQPHLIGRRLRVFTVQKTSNEYADIVERVTSQPVNRTYQTQQERDEIWFSGKNGHYYALQRLIAAADLSKGDDNELLNPGQKYWKPLQFEDLIPSPKDVSADS